MVEFISTYNPMDRGYYGAKAANDMVEPSDRIEQPIEPTLAINEIGASVPEGSRFGTFLQTAQAAIRKGVGHIELSTSMGGGQEEVGAESYGKEARQAIREMAQATGSEFVSVHTPANVGNLSGFDPQRGFDDQVRKGNLEEVKKAINFSADTAGGGAVVVHTGEFQRAMSEAEWAKNADGTYKFLGYQEEPGRAITYMVDDRTGRIISDVRKSQIIREPVYYTAEDFRKENKQVGSKPDGSSLQAGDWVDKDGKYIDPSNPDNLFNRVPIWNAEDSRFRTDKLDWNDIVSRTNQWNTEHPAESRTPEETAYRIQMETQMLQYRGSSLYHGQNYDDMLNDREELKKSLDYMEQVQGQIPEDEQWRIMQNMSALKSHHGRNAEAYAGRTDKKPADIIKEAIADVEKSMKFTNESSASADAQADTIKDTLEHVRPIGDYAKEQSTGSFAEAGIHAMVESKKNPHAKKDIFVAAENIFPEMGYGSHPDEMIELVTTSRQQMVHMLTSREIDSPYGERDKSGHLKKVENPFYQPGISKEQAKKEAKDHLKATLDTQHLGMWFKHFQPKAGEGEGERKERFKKWYMEQIGKLADSDVIGHVHLVDSMGGGHHHLPAGQGDLPLVDAITYLKKKGYTGTIVSEGYGEDRFTPGRQLTSAWKEFGSPIYGRSWGGGGSSMPTWAAVDNAYAGANQPPMFIFGAYSPSNDWQLWSEVPME